MLRQDNADIRLTKKGHEIGLASDERLEKVNLKQAETKEIITFLEKESTDLKSINQILINKNSSPLKQKVKLKTVLSRPHITIYDLFKDPNIEKIKLAFRQKQLNKQK